MNEPIYIKNYQSPFGDLVIGSYEDKLVLCDWKYRKMRESIDLRIKSALKTEFITGSSSVIESTINQREKYSLRKREVFEIPLLLIGTDFQKLVWNKLLAIPFGQTTSYLKLSESLNNPKANRAVASANGANAISIIVPCHLVIGSNQELTGYAGGLTTKKKLLTLENNEWFNKQLQLFY
tara:strand:+ start:2678 stop:3217 length:540 start_codon:yes stop_codon:yes gene_type:complete